MITPSVKHFVFTPSTPIDYTPGQFITIHIEVGDKTLRRSYSLATPPTTGHRLEFDAGFVENGPSTELLFNLKPGDTLNTTGPFGRLILKDEANEPTRYILMATSTGVTPYHAMLPALSARLNANPDLQVVILQGVQTQADLLYHDDFLAFAKQHPNATYRAQLSRVTAETLGESEHLGYVQSSFPALDLNPDADIVYLCGNPGMVDEAFSELKNKDFTIQRIVREKYISR